MELSQSIEIAVPFTINYDDILTITLKLFLTNENNYIFKKDGSSNAPNNWLFNPSKFSSPTCRAIR